MMLKKFNKKFNLVVRRMLDVTRTGEEQTRSREMIKLFSKCFWALVATLFAAPGFAEVDVDRILAKAAMHLDASKPESFVLNESGGVTSWINQSADGRKLYGDAKAHVANKYGTRTTKSWRGWDVPVYDTGTTGSDISLEFTAISNVQTVFWVGDFEKGPSNEYAASLLSDPDGGLCRGEGKGQFVSEVYGRMVNPSYGKNVAQLAFYQNSKTSGGNGTTMIPNSGSIDLVAMRCSENNFRFNMLANDRDVKARDGGCKFCEVIIFTEGLTDDEFNAVYDYLDEKWNYGGWAEGVCKRTWTGLAADGRWASSGNWDTGVPAAVDTVVFTNETDVSTVYNIANGITLLKKSGTGLLTIQNFDAGSPALKMTGGGIVLTGTVPTENPFSSALDRLHLNGLVDLGGAKQTLYATAGEEWLPAGEKIAVTNGTLTIKTTGSYSLFKGDLIALAGGTIDHTNPINLHLSGGATRILADGGTFKCTNNGNSFVGAINGAIATGIVEVVNGGRFTTASKDFDFGKGKGVGKLLVSSGGTADFGTASVVLGGWKRDNSPGTGILRVENATLRLGKLLTELDLSTVDALFDGATIVAAADAPDFLSAAHEESPYVIGEGGLTVSNDGHTVGFTTALRGTGPVTLAGAGRFTFAENYTFPADVVLDGAQVLDPPTGEVWRVPVFSARGKISGYPEKKDAYGNQFYVTSNGGVETLLFGQHPPLTIIIR